MANLEKMTSLYAVSLLQYYVQGSPKSWPDSSYRPIVKIILDCLYTHKATFNFYSLLLIKALFRLTYDGFSILFYFTREKLLCKIQADKETGTLFFD